MTIITEMLRLKAQAFHGHCRIIRWRLSDAQAHELADCMAHMQMHPTCTPQQIYEGLKEGDSQILGARVEVR